MGLKINGCMGNIGVIRTCLLFFVVHSRDTETLELDEDAWAVAANLQALFYSWACGGGLTDVSLSRLFSTSLPRGFYWRHQSMR